MFQRRLELFFIVFFWVAWFSALGYLGSSIPAYGASQVQPVQTTEVSFTEEAREHLSADDISYLERVIYSAAPIHTDHVVFSVSSTIDSTAKSSSYDRGKTIEITFNSKSVARLKQSMPAFAFVVAHEMGHWDPNIRNNASNPHELEHACDFWALLALEELKNINLRKAIGFFNMFSEGDSDSHPASAKRYAKLLKQIKEWEAEDRKYPNGRTH